MSAAPIPDPQEDARLAALAEYDILDTPAESGFDDIVLLATQACRTSVALVSFVARDRQWFKARIGFDPCETPLSQSVCAHALGRDELLIIPDLTLDPRTRDNTLVTGELRIRFYAGAPLRTREGLAVGTLCVIDTEPRPEGLTADEASALAALARQVMVQLELRRAIENREQALAARALVEEQMRLAVDATGIGIFDFDLRSGELRWDARVRALFGVPARGPVTYAETYLGGVHPDDRARADAAVQAALDPAGTRVLDIDYRVIAADTGAERWLSARGQAIVEDGVTIRFIGSVRDVTGDKAADAALKATEERYRLAARATTDAIWDWDLVADHVHWNEALTLVHGHDLATIPPTGAWWLGQIHPEDRDRVARGIQAVIDGGGETWTDTYRFRRSDGSDAAVIDRGYLIRDDAGRAVRMIGAMLDVTRQNETEQRLRRSEERLSLAFEAAGAVGWWDWDIPNDRLVANEMFAELSSVDPAEAAAGTPIARYVAGIHPEDRDWVGARIAEAVETGGEFAEEYRLCRADGAVRWVYARGRCYQDADGRPLRYPGVAVEITERKRTEAALAASQARLDTILQTMPVGLLLAEAPSGRVLFGNPRLERILGHSVLEAAGLAGHDAYHADGRSVAPDEHPLARIVGGGADHAELEAHYQRPDGSRRWIEIIGEAVKDAAGTTVGAVIAVSDIEDRKRAEAQQDILHHELGHRLKNTLALVQAIAAQTLRNVTDVEAAREALSARLVAMGKAHDILLSGPSESAGMEAVLRGALSIHDDDGGPARFRLAGPDLAVGPKAALSLALMAHELATNAVKYGALSVPDGSVVLRWEVEGEGADAQVHLLWREQDGPPVAEPTRKGFGTRLIERGLVGAIGGAVVLSYPETGVTCTVTAPLGGLAEA
ncbi:PAS domain-containing protein [uncultured Methylobacterium sp.]|uniref:PAS domain-containing protein n=1 Tax=uncultured Methylobacterium sp. TaxID=157278 RepID=UPI0035C95243